MHTCIYVCFIKNQGWIQTGVWTYMHTWLNMCMWEHGYKRMKKNYTVSLIFLIFFLVITNITSIVHTSVSLWMLRSIHTSIHIYMHECINLHANTKISVFLRAFHCMCQLPPCAVDTQTNITFFLRAFHCVCAGLWLLSMCGTLIQECYSSFLYGCALQHFSASMCMCMCMCICVCVYVYVYICVCIGMCMCMYVLVWTRSSTFLCDLYGYGYGYV
jgi:hypothetical protein